MSVEKREYYIVECDGCEELLDIQGEGGFTVFRTKEEAENMWQSAGWIKKDWGLQCDGCQDEIRLKHEIDELQA
jgi:hypothetical protein